MPQQGRFHRNETKACLIIWVSAVLYSIYRFTEASQNYFHKYHDDYEDFTNGWSILGPRRKDNADFEWGTIYYFFNNVYPVMLLYLIICESARYLLQSIKLHQYLQILFPMIYLAYCMGYGIALIALLQPVLFYVVGAFKSKPFVWICNLVCLAFITLFKMISAKEEFLRKFGLNHFQTYLSILLLCWMNLKCTSFFLNVPVKWGALDYATYCVYFPTLFTGPFIGYGDFQKRHNKDNSNLEKRLTTLAFNILRCLFGTIFVDFCLHFLYVNAASFQLQLIEKLDLCSLCGYGYLMGQLFHIKYIILYGLSTSLAAFDNIAVPRLPRCIGRVHLYSDMWRYFDPGLYQFLKSCIFVPLLNLGVKKFAASFLCFLFVFVWHGIEDYILIWAGLNFLGVVLEDLGSSFYIAHLKSSIFMKKIGSKGLRRLKCLMTAPLLAMSAISNFYFFAGKDVGDVFVLKSLTEPSFNKFLVIFVLYCCCEVSTELRDVDARKM